MLQISLLDLVRIDTVSRPYSIFLCFFSFLKNSIVYIFYQMKLNEQVQTAPTIGFNVETVTLVKGVTFDMWDVGGQETIRALWRHYYANTEVSQ